ncbi:uncharacterized protein LY89DRAFT_765924 [Mollisia scopiformis]|uniref:Uncharacterized protein n=1 Tax=Mollisia scopiformis TaxID=149040 RepID=A0A132B630_MOLSC|nr:uncharacterized protein LY89DRAFT_765924 [Mollisia scopiformis]KUJ07868.1 hypothetical protein LY89DRAFT_765924 [Mollisia scopiformis]
MESTNNTASRSESVVVMIDLLRLAREFQGAGERVEVRGITKSTSNITREGDNENRGMILEFATGGLMFVFTHVGDKMAATSLSSSLPDTTTAENFSQSVLNLMSSERITSDPDRLLFQIESKERVSLIDVKQAIELRMLDDKVEKIRAIKPRLPYGAPKFREMYDLAVVCSNAGFMLPGFSAQLSFPTSPRFEVKRALGNLSKLTSDGIRFVPLLRSMTDLHKECDIREGMSDEETSEIRNSTLTTPSGQVVPLEEVEELLRDAGFGGKDDADIHLSEWSDEEMVQLVERLAKASIKAGWI